MGRFKWDNRLCGGEDVLNDLLAGGLVRDPYGNGPPDGFPVIDAKGYPSGYIAAEYIKNRDCMSIYAQSLHIVTAWWLELSICYHVQKANTKPHPEMNRTSKSGQ